MVFSVLFLPQRSPHIRYLAAYEVYLCAVLGNMENTLLLSIDDGCGQHICALWEIYHYSTSNEPHVGFTAEYLTHIYWNCRSRWKNRSTHLDIKPGSYPEVFFFRNGGCAPASASKRCIRLMTTWIDGGHTYYHCWAWTKLQVLLYHYFSAGIRSGLIRYLHVITYMIRWLGRQACYASWYNRIVVSTSWKLYFFHPYLATHVFGDQVWSLIWPTKNWLYITKLYY
jgi:hypothetical protein